MPITINPDRIAEYEAERAEIMSAYTPRLKAMSANDPELGRVWDARADALRALAEKYAMPAEGGA
jgi:hypothetical protein